MPSPFYRAEISVIPFIDATKVTLPAEAETAIRNGGHARFRSGSARTAPDGSCLLRVHFLAAADAAALVAVRHIETNVSGWAETKQVLTGRGRKTRDLVQALG